MQSTELSMSPSYSKHQMNPNATAYPQVLRPAKKHFLDRQYLQEVRRAVWKAENVEINSKIKHSTLPYKHVVFDQTHTEQCSSLFECSGILREIQRTHLAQGKRDIGYNFAIGGDGWLYKCRGWYFSPEMPEQFNHITEPALYVAFIGDFTWVNPPFTMAFSSVNFLKLALRKKIILPTFKLTQLKKTSPKL